MEPKAPALVINWKEGTSMWEVPSLTDEQQEIVYSGRDNICVIAYPAVGKTHVCIAFALQLINTGIDPDDILVFTFTVSGREVLTKRLTGTGVKVYTIHGHGMRHSRKGRKAFLDSPEEMRDFPSLLRPRAEGEKHYKWVICDEGQDLSELQYLSFLSWADHHFLVGDPAQSIFQYSGASPAFLERFADDYCEGHHFTLRTNHRSTSSIVEVANKFSGRDMTYPDGTARGRVELSYRVPPGLDNLTILARTKKEVEHFHNYLLHEKVPHTWIQTQDGQKRLCQNFSADGTSREVSSVLDFFSSIVCTFHCAKGDEWPRVWCVYKTPKGADMEEEECIFYVGITRARQELYIYDDGTSEYVRRIRQWQRGS